MRLSPSKIGVPMCLAVAFLAAPGGTEDKVYFGNLHSHTSYSDGSGTPADAFHHARHVAKLDFLAVTEHNHAQAESGAGDRRDGLLIATNPSLYKGAQAESLISAATARTMDGSFVALYGQEFSSISSGNHVNVFDVDDVISAPNGRFDTLIDTWLPAHLDSTGQPAIIQLNHPALFRNEAKAYGADDFASPAQWISKLDQNARLIEILNGPAMTETSGNEPAERMESHYLHYLRLGLHVAPTGDQDNHYFTWGDATDVRTAVIADVLTKPSLLAGLRARHVYATEDKNLRMIFKVNGSLIGDRITAPALNSPLTISYSIKDDDEPAATYTIQVVSNVIGGGDDLELATVEQTGDTSAGNITGLQYSGGAQYVLFKVTQFDETGEDRAWTAPVWLEPAGAAQPAGPSPEASFVASRNSGVYHVSPECHSAQMIAERNRITGPQAKQGRRKHFGCPVT